MPLLLFYIKALLIIYLSCLRSLYSASNSVRQNVNTRNGAGLAMRNRIACPPSSVYAKLNFIISDAEMQRGNYRRNHNRCVANAISERHIKYSGSSDLLYQENRSDKWLY